MTRLLITRSQLMAVAASLGLLASVVGLVVILPRDASAHWARSHYSWSSKDGNCAKPIDPVNVAFRGSHAAFFRVKRHLRYHGWGTHENGSTQYIRDEGFCTAMEGQLADAGGSDTRFHVRLWQKIHSDPGGSVVTLGTAHHELETGCGHAVDWYNRKSQADGARSGFNRAKDRMGVLFKHGPHHHQLYHRNWGNSMPMRQCADNPGDPPRWAASSGDVILITLGRL